MSIIAPIFIVLGLVAVAAVAAFLISRSRQGMPVVISLRFVLLAYFYLISLVSLVTLVTGLTPLLNAGISVVLGRQFSYEASPMIRAIPPPPPTIAPPPGLPPKPAEPLTPSPEEQRVFQERQLRARLQDDIIGGASRVLVASLIWFFHTLGRRALRKTPIPGDAFLNQAYLVVLLLIFGIVSIVSLPNALHQTVRFYFYVPVQPYDFRPAPGNALATAIAFVPFWVYYLKTTLTQLSAARNERL